MNKIFYRTVAISLGAFALCTAPSSQGQSSPSAEQASSADTPPKIIFGSCKERPIYPETARQEKREGTVVLAFHVDADDSLLEAGIKQSSGHADLDESARVGLSKCKFQAATKNGVPVRGWTTLRYKWVPEK